MRVIGRRQPITDLGGSTGHGPQFVKIKNGLAYKAEFLYPPLVVYCNVSDMSEIFY